jgi:hypothetical protein
MFINAGKRELTHSFLHCNKVMAISAGQERERWAEWEREQDVVSRCLTFPQLCVTCHCKFLYILLFFTHFRSIMTNVQQTLDEANEKGIAMVFGYTCFSVQWGYTKLSPFL